MQTLKCDLNNESPIVSLENITFSLVTLGRENDIPYRGISIIYTITLAV